MSANITERRLIDVLTCWARGRYQIAKEVPHFEKRIDFAFIKGESGEICTIEAKTKNWRRAIQQATLNLTATHRSYIAIFNENVRRVSREAIRNSNIGLISVGTKWGDVKTRIYAPESPYINPHSLNHLKNHIVSENK